MRRIITSIATVVASAAAMAQIPAVGNGGGTHVVAGHHPQGSMMPFIFLGILLVVFYFFLIRPQQKRNREQKNMLSNLSAGDEVATMGGMFGKVKKVGDDSIDLELSKGVVVTFQKQAITTLLPKGTIKHA